MIFTRKRDKVQPKIFCIGRNKTGTTSVKKTFEFHNIKVGNQYKAEKLIDFYANRNFKRIAKYCGSAQAFQDIPFSLPFTYIYLDNTFPNSKFILTIRNDVDEWYNSLVNFHAKVFGKNGSLPTKKDLQEAKYIHKGYAWKVNRILHNTPEDDIYNEQALKKSYLNYNQSVIDYFKYKDNLLIINVAEKGAYHKFCSFLNLNPIIENFPWENKTKTK